MASTDGSKRNHRRLLACFPCFPCSTAEDAFIGTLRTHYARNGTAESFAPAFAQHPQKTYSRGRARDARARGAAGGLAAQERALWEEREEELLDAQVS